LCTVARFDLANRGMRQSIQRHTCARLLIFDKTSAQPHFAVVNCSDAVMRVLLRCFNMQPNIFAVMNCCVEALSLLSPDIVTWSAGNLDSVQ